MCGIVATLVLSGTPTVSDTRTDGPQRTRPQIRLYRFGLAFTLDFTAIEVLFLIRTGCVKYVITHYEEIESRFSQILIFFSFF